MHQENMLQPILVRETEAAQLLVVDVQTLRRWRRLGDGPPYVKYGTSQGSPVRYPLNEIHRWIAARLRTSTSQQTDEPGQ